MNKAVGPITCFATFHNVVFFIEEFNDLLYMSDAIDPKQYDTICNGRPLTLLTACI